MSDPGTTRVKFSLAGAQRANQSVENQRRKREISVELVERFAYEYEAENHDGLVSLVSGRSSCVGCSWPARELGAIGSGLLPRNACAGVPPGLRIVPNRCTRRYCCS